MKGRPNVVKGFRCIACKGPLLKSEPLLVRQIKRFDKDGTLLSRGREMAHRRCVPMPQGGPT